MSQIMPISGGVPLSPLGEVRPAARIFPQPMKNIFSLGYERTSSKPLFKVARSVAADVVDIYDFQQSSLNYSLSAGGAWVDGTGETFSVETWYDQYNTGSTYDAVYNTGFANSKPDLQLNVDNGWPAIKFDGLNQHLLIPNTASLTLTDGTDYNDIPIIFKSRCKFVTTTDVFLYSKDYIASGDREYSLFIADSKIIFVLLTIDSTNYITGMSNGVIPAGFFDLKTEYDGTKNLSGITHNFDSVASTPTLNSSNAGTYTGQVHTDSPFYIGTHFQAGLPIQSFDGWINQLSLVRS